MRRYVSRWLPSAASRLSAPWCCWPRHSRLEAHETRTIADGQYQIVVGFMNEPVFAGDKSGLEFWVTEAVGGDAGRRRG